MTQTKKLKGIFFIVLLSLLFSSKAAKAQWTLGFTIGGIGYHPKSDNNSKHYKWKLGKKGKLVGFASLSVLVSYRFNDYVGLKFANTMIFNDCAGKFAGLAHLGIDLHDNIIGIKSPTHQMSASFGPLWYYRKNWSQESWYQNNPRFMKMDKNGIWERKFVWHGGQLQYNYYFDEHHSIGGNILPGHPFLYANSVGYFYTE